MKYKDEAKLWIKRNNIKTAFEVILFAEYLDRRQARKRKKYNN